MHISEDEEGVKEIELSDDPYDCMRVNVENVPCIVTLCKVQHSLELLPTMHSSHVQFCVSVAFYILDVCVCVSDWSQTCGGRHVTGKGLLCGQSSDFSHTPRDGHMRQENGKRKSGPRKYL